MFAKHAAIASGAMSVAGTTVALLLVWWVLASGFRALQDVDESGDTPFAEVLRGGPAPPPDVVWRESIVRNPTNARAYRKLAGELEWLGKRTEAASAWQHALFFDPTHPKVLREAARFYLRGGDAARALPLLRRVVDLYPDLGSDIWPIFAAELESGRGSEFLIATARENPAWWTRFFRDVCAQATNADLLTKVFAARIDAGVVTNGERTCLIERRQREGRWAAAYELWRASLPVEQRKEVGALFNGGFEWALSNVGFDWLVPKQDAASVEVEAINGAQGKQALHVTFVNRRYAAPPIQQYLMLRPGRHRLEGLRRADALDSWLGLQWGVYCMPAGAGEPRQIVRTEPFSGSGDWGEFRRDFTVPSGCAVQVLRLELANPRGNAETPGDVAVRLRGSLWFDDLGITALE